MEAGIIIGLLIMLLGLGLLGYAVIGWESVHFGRLSYQASLRKVIPAVICISLGIQTVFSGFVLAMLGLER